ncbi:3-oxoacyl-[acyl-carrier protein] reductase [Evansella vedderi]|uniref:3-oxoacyl-[acyl-carrier protein] reductase n=1 Tax=Evansella vedderi TaxID=38282 RepID=A0ABU0A3S7_9BACI|nr:SDR family NAD(P)-dependent oxidoreductase [Evansella vedderi]MDQ0257333.1 3-oxoacyl-[acyl-carrier protein] reductase [Evansella vedderi]
MKIKGKTALITGASTGIGRSIAVKLASEGANIIINYSRSTEEAEKTLSMIRDVGARGMIYQADVSDKIQVEKMFKEALEQFNGIDILVNNAGTTDFVPLKDLDGLLDEYWDRAFNVNVKGMFYTSRVCASELKKNKGCIVNITSIAGLNGNGSSIAYAASKAAGISVTKSLARVLAPRVRVNSIAPGVVKTRWVDGQEEHVDQYRDGTLLNRVASPDDVAEITAGIIEGGDFVTGQTIVVDGGWSI